MKNFTLGLDIGITSVGWGIVEKDSGTIIDAGVRLFEEGTSEGNNKRRSFRSSRRLKRRKAFRILRMENLLKKNGILTKEYRVKDYNPYECRVKGLTQKLTNNELTSAILHITKLRGSSLETVIDENDKDQGVIKETLNLNNRLLQQNKYICEIQLDRLKSEGKIRGSSNIFTTKDYLKELKAILKNQDLEDSLINNIVDIVKSRRHFSEGPGGKNSPTPYGRYLDFNSDPINLIEKMRGKCSIFKDQPRASINSFTYCLYNIYNDLNNLTIKDRKLSTEEKEYLLNNFILVGKNITLKEISKLTKTEPDDIKGYRIDKSGKPVFTEFKLYNNILKKVKEINGGDELINNHEAIDKIADILTETKVLEERVEKIKEFVTEEIAILVSQISSVSKYGHLSYKALKLFVDEMKTSSDNQMIISSRLNLKKEYEGYLKDKKNIPFEIEDITNPVVIRSFRETIKVINGIRKKYGEPESIVIELARKK